MWQGAFPKGGVRTSLDSVVIDSLVTQARRLWLFIAAGVGAAGLVLLATYLLSVVEHVPVSELMRDPAAVSELPGYIGLLSNLGVVLWFAAAAVCVFAAAVVWASHRSIASLLLSAGLLGGLLALDDLFMIHEQVFPALFKLPDSVLLVLYAGLILWFLVYHLPGLLATNYLLLLLSLAFFGGSIMADQVLPMTEGGIFIEDGLKFAGIVFWLVYFSLTCFDAVRGATQHAHQPASVLERR